MKITAVGVLGVALLAGNYVLAIPLPQELQRIEKKYKAQKTVIAEFVQISHIAALNVPKKSSGTLWLSRPARVRWETTEPQKDLMVSDGKSFWFYTPPLDNGDRGNVIIRKGSDVQSKLLRGLLTGNFSTVPGVKINAQANNQYEIVPKVGVAGDVVSAIVQINPKLDIIEKVKLEQKDGGVIELELKNVKLGEKIAENLFKFVIPADTDVNRE